MSRHLEIERKFLIKSLPSGLKRKQHSTITQGYLPGRQEGMSVRLRRQGSKYLLTLKAGQGRKRIEEEVPISKSSFEALWPLTRSARIQKRRFKIPLNGDVIELDLYAGAHEGLAIAEVEFDSDRDSRAFQAPSWMGREVTADPRYANESLARRGKRPK